MRKSRFALIALALSASLAHAAQPKSVEDCPAAQAQGTKLYLPEALDRGHMPAVSAPAVLPDLFLPPLPGAKTRYKTPILLGEEGRYELVANRATYLKGSKKPLEVGYDLVFVGARVLEVGPGQCMRFETKMIDKVRTDVLDMPVLEQRTTPITCPVAG